MIRDRIPAFIALVTLGAASVTLAQTSPDNGSRSDQHSTQSTPDQQSVPDQQSTQSAPDRQSSPDQQSSPGQQSTSDEATTSSAESSSTERAVQEQKMKDCVAEQKARNASLSEDQMQQNCMLQLMSHQGH